MSPIRPWIPVIGAGAIALLCLLAATHTGRNMSELAPLPPPIHVRGTDVADLGAEISVPLFAPSRSVVPSGAEPATPPAPPPQLAGIVLGGGRAVALIKSANGGETLMLHAGDSVDGWRIVGIGARQIVVARDGAQQIVALEFGASKTPPRDNTGALGGVSSTKTASPSFDGLAAVTRLGLPAQNIPLGSPLAPPR